MARRGWWWPWCRRLLLYPGTGPGVALLAFLLAVSLGMTLGWALRSGWRFSRSLAVMSVALLGRAGRVRSRPVAGVRSHLHRVQAGLRTTVHRQRAADVQRGRRERGHRRTSVTSYARQIVDVFPYIAPGVLGMVVVLVAACTAGLAYLIFPRLRKPQAVGMSLSGFRMHWGVAYVSIVGLAHAAVHARRTRVEGVPVLRGHRLAAGVADAVLPAGAGRASLARQRQAVAVRARATLRCSYRRWWRRLFQFTGLMGLLDTWIDYRKRFALKGSGPGSLR